MLHETLNKWLNKRDKGDALRVLSGGPGSGKSSFAKMWAAEIAERAGMRVLYVPLHNFNLKSTLEEAVGNYVRQTAILSRNPLDVEKGEKHLLLILDGLDEIAERGRASAELARNFVVEVDKTLAQRNHMECRVQALLTGRDLAVQSNATHFRKEKQILHALPYKVEEPRRFKDAEKILAEDQRDLWWRNYGQAIGEDFKGIPTPLKRSDLIDVTAEPLLNYLVALVYKRGELDFTQEDINLNLIYEDLLKGVHEPGYKPKANVTELKFHEFARALEEIALAVWHGNGRTTTVGEIQKHCEKSGSKALLDKFEEGAKSGVTRLLTAFYFREHGQDAMGDSTFEFTHKSFGEYLTAKRIVRALQKIVRELERRRDSFDEGWDERRALLEWAEICGPTTLDSYVLAFLRREIALFGIETTGQWQVAIRGLINAVLRIGTPMESLDTKLSFKEMLRQSRNAEEALLALHYFCAVITQEVSTIEWIEPT